MPTVSIQLTRDVAYQIREVDQPRELIVLLHGWQQNGASILRTLMDCMPEDAVLVAPDGVYPMPSLGSRGVKMAHAWYIFDAKANTYLVDMSHACTYVAETVKALGFDHIPKRVVGFSQGGYLAPFAGMAMENVTQVIAINSRYRDEVLTSTLPFRVDAINGMADTQVDPQRARECHARVIAAGNKGVFRPVSMSRHTVDEPIKDGLRELIAQGT